MIVVIDVRLRRIPIKNGLVKKSWLEKFQAEISHYLIELEKNH